MSIRPIIYDYSVVGDFITLILCIINYLLLGSSYARKEKNLTVFLCSNGCLIAAAFSSILYFYFLPAANAENAFWLCVLGSFRRITLVLLYVMFIQYLCNLVHMEEKYKRIFNLIEAGYFFFAVISLTVTLFTEQNVYIGMDFPKQATWLHTALSNGYVMNSLLAILIMISFRNRFVTKMRNCIISLGCMSILVIIVEAFIQNSSYTCISFYFPVLGCLVLFHHNAFDVNTGCLDRYAFTGYVHDIKDANFYLICLTLRQLPEHQLGKMKDFLFHFNETYFKNVCIFRISDNKLVAVIKPARNEHPEEKFSVLLSDFKKLYYLFNIPYKIVFIPGNKHLTTALDYLELDAILEEDMDWNEYHFCDDTNMDKYIHAQRIESILFDIEKKGDPYDDRVMVLCQPVLNTVTNKFATAEVLMRIISDGELFYPDEFIPVAERKEFIHTLSCIILRKTCKKILEFESEGYHVERISVNFSMIELQNTHFCRDVIDIIEESGVDPSKIAIELTESQNDQDFQMDKNVIQTLHAYGIKFYLDDFGTGYSNFARIMNLPIDIIKFDRSLTAMSGKDVISQNMVEGFSDIFDNSNYKILFEGVETDQDESRCIKMKAQYLQGYKYSKPIPIDDLKNFLDKKSRK